MTALAPPTAFYPVHALHDHSPNVPPLWFALRPYVLAGVSACFAQTIVQPVDLLKTRMQLAGVGVAGGGVRVSPLALARGIVAADGAAGLYHGLSAAWLNQSTYGAVRIGLFRVLCEHLQDQQDAQQQQQSGVSAFRTSLPLWQKMVCGSVSGAAGAVIGTPADVALVRMQSDNMRPLADRRQYRHVIHALTSIIQRHGVAAAFAGCTPIVVRAIVHNAVMLSMYDQGKEFCYERMQIGAAAAAGGGAAGAAGAGASVTALQCNFVASLAASAVACVFSMPLDFLKTRMQQQQRHAVTGVLRYNSVVAMGVATVRREGLLSLYKGFSMYLARMAPHTVITFCTMDYLVERLGKQGM